MLAATARRKSTVPAVKLVAVVPGGGNRVAPTGQPAQQGRPKVRRASTQLRFNAMSAEEKKLCFTFRSMPQLDHLTSLVTSLAVCVAVTVLFIVPYAANERYLGSAALRGFVVALLACFFAGNLAVLSFRLPAEASPSRHTLEHGWSSRYWRPLA